MNLGLTAISRLSIILVKWIRLRFKRLQVFFAPTEMVREFVDDRSSNLVGYFVARAADFFDRAFKKPDSIRIRLVELLLRDGNAFEQPEQCVLFGIEPEAFELPTLGTVANVDDDVIHPLLKLRRQGFYDFAGEAAEIVHGEPNIGKIVRRVGVAHEQLLKPWRR